MFDNICYHRNFLTEVIARIDLMSNVEGLDAQLPKELRDSAKEHFRIAAPKEMMMRGIEASFRPDREDRLQSVQKQWIQWNFHGVNRDKTLTIEPDAVYVVYNVYQSYETLASEFLGFTGRFFSVFSDVQVKRLGLRYVNNIEFGQGDPLDWEQYLDPQMLCLLKFPSEPETIARAFNILELAFGEFNVRCRFGIYNPDFPARIRRRSFALDFDAYYEGLMEPTEIESSLGKFHLKIQELFEHSITEPLREFMNRSE